MATIAVSTELAAALQEVKDLAGELRGYLKTYQETAARSPQRLDLATLAVCAQKEVRFTRRGGELLLAILEGDASVVWSHVRGELVASELGRKILGGLERAGKTGIALQLCQILFIQAHPGLFDLQDRTESLPEEEDGDENSPPEEWIDG